MCHSTGSIGDTPIGPFYVSLMKKDYLTALIQYITPKLILTLLCGWFADIKHTRLKNFFIERFIKLYQVNMTEALHPDPHYYATFNDFFIRHLNPASRIVSQSPFISPVDGSVSQIGQIQKGQVIQAKGRNYSLSRLLQDEKRAAIFEQGLFATLYLSPKDYHRIHMPIDGQVRKMIYVPGKLFSVQPATTRVIPHLFAENERVVVFFDTPMGEMVMVLVGATIVGKIATQWHGEFTREQSIRYFDYPKDSLCLKKGEEMGYFKLGSTVILILSPQFPYAWDGSLKENRQIQLFEGLVK